MTERIKKSVSILLALLMVFSIFSSQVFASNSEEIESYLDSAYAKAIDPYGSTTKNDDGQYIIPLSKTSLTLKKDSSSKLYTAEWSSSDESLAKITSNYSSSASAKITHPSAETGDQTVTVTLTLKSKSDGTEVGTRDFVLLIKAQLPVYNTKFSASDESGKEIADFSVLVKNQRNVMVSAKYDGSYDLTAETTYTYTVSAPGYIRVTKNFTVSQNGTINVTLTEGFKASFSVKLANGNSTASAAIKVISADSTTTYESVKDEYGYDTYDYELKDGTYLYSISYSGGSQTASGEFTVSGADITVPVQLTETLYPIKIKVLPESTNAEVVLKKNGYSGAYGDPILPDGNGVYNIPSGQYRYTVSADGYETVSSTFNSTDTSLKNKGYVLTITLKNEAETVLKKACDIIFSESGEGITLSEFTGSQGYDYDFKCVTWDVDSDFDDVNVNTTISKLLSQKIKDKGSLIGVSLISVKDQDGDEDYSVIEEDGTIDYNSVSYNMIDEDYGGAVYEAEIQLTYNGKTATEDATFVVPMHTYTRTQRLDDAADYASRFSTIQANNASEYAIKGNLNLPDLSENESYNYYYICSSWTSDHPEIIDKNGKVTAPENDTVVTLTVKTFYSESFVDNTDFFFDPGDLGDNESLATVKVTVLSAKSKLTDSLKKANDLYNGSSEGNGSGEYPVGSRAELKAVIDSATAVLNSSASAAELDAASAKLDEAIKTFSDKQNDVIVTITGSVSYANSFIYPYQSLTVTSGTAFRLGYPVEAAKTVNALDVLVQIHKETFGDDFTNDPTSYLEVNKNGYITRIMGEKTSACGFFKNQKYPVDAYGTGTTITGTLVNSGDSMEYFLYNDTRSYSDKYLFFDKSSAEVYVGDSITLTLKGFTAMFAYDSSLSVPTAIESAEILVGTDKNSLTSIGKFTDENGNITLSFDKSGTYYISVQADYLDTSYYIPAVCMIKVLDRHVISVNAPESFTYNQFADITVTVKSGASKIRFVNESGSTWTYNRDNSRVLSITDNGDGTETWVIKFTAYASNTEYFVYAKYNGEGWSNDFASFTLKEKDPDKKVYSYTVDGRQDDGSLKAGLHDVTVVTGTDVFKVQLYLNGNTWTYSSANASYKDIDGKRIWSFKTNFCIKGDVQYGIRVRTAVSAFEFSDETISLNVHK